MAGAASLPAGHVPSFLGRVGRMLVAPWREWETVAGEGTTARDLYVGYVAPLAAIGAVASLVASTVVGVDVGATRVRAGIPAGVAAALLRYALAFAAVALLARIAASLAPRFGGQGDRVVALRVVVYSLIPAWLAAALNATPALQVIAAVLALYSAFVLFVGLRTVMRCPEGWAIFLAGILSALAWVFGALATPVASFTAGLAGIGSPAPGARDRAYAAGAATSLLATMVLESDARDRRRVFDAVGSVAGLGAGFVRDIVGDGNGDGDALLDRVAAEAATVAAGGRKFELVPPESLIPLLPPTVAGMPRVSATALIDAPVFTLKGSIARARYERGSAHVELELGDMGELWGVVRLIARFDPLFEKTSASVRERSGRIDGRYFQEKFDERDGSGKFGRLLDDRFAVAARGSGVTLAALHEAVEAVDAAAVVALGRTR
jgi:hypothetical protein